MLTVASLANQFPSPFEPYVCEEIDELRRRGIRVISGSVCKPGAKEEKILAARYAPDIVLQPLRLTVLLRALILCLRRWKQISPLLGRVVFRGHESPLQRVKALVHTWLGACYAVMLEQHRVNHIHVHHGYFGSWIAMTAARLLDVGFTMTLYGSDLLLHGTYLDLKLENCSLCPTVSEYNRRYILEHYPAVDAPKVMVWRMGVEISEHKPPALLPPSKRQPIHATGFGPPASGEESRLPGAGLRRASHARRELRVLHRRSRAGTAALADSGPRLRSRGPRGAAGICAGRATGLAL